MTRNKIRKLWRFQGSSSEAFISSNNLIKPVYHRISSINAGKCNCLYSLQSYRIVLNVLPMPINIGATRKSNHPSLPWSVLVLAKPHIPGNLSVSGKLGWLVTLENCPVL